MSFRAVIRYAAFATPSYTGANVIRSLTPSFTRTTSFNAAPTVRERRIYAKLSVYRAWA